MSDLETVTCDSCGNDFKAVAGAAAMNTGYCSPSCHVAGEDLT